MNPDQLRAPRNQLARRFAKGRPVQSQSQSSRGPLRL